LKTVGAALPSVTVVLLRFAGKDRDLCPLWEVGRRPSKQVRSNVVARGQLSRPFVFRRQSARLSNCHSICWMLQLPNDCNSAKNNSDSKYASEREDNKT
jgi:hypothetical protein